MRKFIKITMLIGVAALLPLLWAQAADRNPPLPQQQPGAGDEFGMPPGDDFGPPPMEAGPPPAPTQAQQAGTPPAGQDGRDERQGHGQFGRPGQRILNAIRGQGGGGFGGPGAIASPERLIRMDHDLQEVKVNFLQQEQRRKELMAALEQAQAKAGAGHFSPAGLIDRQQLDDTLGRLHELAEREQNLADQAGRMLKMIAVTHRMWQPMIADGSTSHAAAGPQAGPIAGEIKGRWRAADDAMLLQSGTDFAQAFLGAEFGAIAFQAAETAPDGPTLTELLRPENQRPAQLMRLGEAGRQRLMQRMDRLEQKVAQLLSQAQAQQREISRLREALDRGNNPPRN